MNETEIKGLIPELRKGAEAEVVAARYVTDHKFGKDYDSISIEHTARWKAAEVLERLFAPVGVHDPSGLQAEAEDILERLKDAWDFDAVMGDACDMDGEWSRAAEWRWKRAKLALEIIRSTEPTPPVTSQVGGGDADAQVEGAGR